MPAPPPKEVLPTKSTRDPLLAKSASPGAAYGAPVRRRPRTPDSRSLCPTDTLEPGERNATDPIRRTRIPTSRLVAKAIARLQDSATIASSQKGQWFRVA
jgi:hypothetical protein